MSSDAVHVVCAVPYPLETAPGQRFRWEQWAPGLREQGVDLEFLPFSTSAIQEARELKRPVTAGILAMRRWPGWARDFAAARRADVVVVFRNAAIAGPPVAEIALGAAGTPMVYDFDDAIFLPPEGGDGLLRRILRCDWRVGVLCRRARLVSVGNGVLAQYAARFSKQVKIWPTTIALANYSERAPSSNPPPVIGWSGSQSTAQYLEWLLPLLRDLRKEISFRVLVMGASVDLDGLEGECLPWSPEMEVPTLHRMDIGIMPLRDTAWARGKCALKALQYLAVGVPAVVSDVGENARAVPNGKCGFVVRTPEEWKTRLLELLKNPGLRMQFGSAGRQHVEQHYSAEVWVPRIAETLRSLAGR